MDSSSNRSQSRAGKSCKKLRNTPRITDSSVTNEIINKNDAVDEDACRLVSDRTKISNNISNSKFDSGPASSLTFEKRSESRENNDADTTSCRPCSVILERLSKKDLRKLLSKSNSSKKKSKKKESRKKQRPASAKSINSKQLGAAPNSLITYDKGFENFPSEGLQSQVKSVDSSNEIVKSTNEFRASFAGDEIKTSQHLLHQDKVTINNLNSNKAGELDPRQPTRPIGDSNTNEGSSIGEENSKRKVLQPNRLKRSLRSNTIYNTKDNETGKRVSPTEIKQTGTIEQDKEVAISAENDKTTSLMLKQIKPMLKNEIDGTENTDDPCSKSTQARNINEINHRELGLYDSETKASQQKHFKLSLRNKRNDTKDDVACKRDSSSKELKDSEEMDNSSVLDLNHLRLLIKRRQDGTEQDETSIRKSKKLRGKQDSSNHNYSNKDELNSVSRESCIVRSPNRKSQDPQVLSNRSKKRNRPSKVQDTAPIVKNLRISLEKLNQKANPSMPGQDNNVEGLNCCVEKSEPVVNCQTQLLETQSKVSSPSSTKSRNTKITDYFFKIDKSSVLPKSNTTDSNQVMDSLLKKKYGISKDVIVLLVDINTLKIPTIKYSASEIKTLTQKYHADSTINIESTSTTENVSLFSIPINKLSPSFDELPTNEEQLSTDITHLLSANDHVEKPSHDSIQTLTIPVAKNPSSPRVLSPSKVKKPLAALHESISDKQISTDFTNVSRVDDLAVQSTNDSVQTQTILDSENVLPRSLKPSQNIQTPPTLQDSNRKTPRAKKQSPTKDTQDALNDNVLVITSTPRSRKEKLSSNNCNKNLSITQEVPDKDLSPENTVELRSSPYGSPTNAKEDENRSAACSSKNTTPKSQKILSLQLKKLTLSPEGRVIFPNNEIPLNKPQIHATDSNSRSPKTVEMVSGVSPDDNKLQKKTADTLVLSKDADNAKSQLDTHPAEVSTTKSLTNMGISLTCLKKERPRHLPVNSMTIVSREMIEEDNSWMELDNTIDNLNNDSTTPALNHAIEENASPALDSSHDTTKEKPTTSCNTAMNADDNCIGDSNLAAGNSLLMKLLVSQNTENVPPQQSAGNFKPPSDAVTTIIQSNIAVEQINRIQDRNLVAEVETPAASIPKLIPPPSVDDETHSISVTRIDQKCANSNVQEELSSNSEQEDQLIIDMNRSDSVSLSGEDTGSSSLSCSNNNLGTVVRDEDECKKTPVSSEKVCVICKRTFKNISGLVSHLKTHITVTHTLNRCYICDKRVTKKNTIEHYLQHCVPATDDQFGSHSCGICQLTFKKKSSLSGHMKSKHSVRKTRIRSKVNPTSENYNKCTICQETYNSKEDLFSHVLKHTSQELQDAFAVEKAKLDLKSGETTVLENQDSSTPEEEKTQDKQKSTESTEANDTLPTSTPPVANCDVSICICHKDERLEMSKDVIIEIALTCMECKTFFKTKKCFEDHYNSTSCRWSDKTVVTPSMFCNKCCTILNNLQDMHGHLTKHENINVDMQTSMLCKYCNILFYGVGSLFYAHWSEHRKNPLFLAKHYSFPQNTRVKIIELGGSEPNEEGQPTESLFIADHQCQSCEKPFHSEDELKKHAKSCSKKVGSESQVIENPNSVFKLICSMCNKEFIDKTTFDSHIEEHVSIKDLLQVPKFLKKSLENNQLTCSICKIEYDTITSYKEHFKRHEVIQEKFLCNYCTLMMDSVEDFERHFAEHKGTREKPVSCKVIFAINKFHCKVCKIWVDNQSLLDEHLATHNNSIACNTKLMDNSASKTAPVIEKQSHICVKCQKEFDDQLKLDAHVATHNVAPSGHSTEDSIFVHLSDDSNSTDIEIIAAETTDASEETVVEDTLAKEQQETLNTQEPKKSAFLRVKNLEELLPYSCSKCKAEFDTSINLGNHTCLQDVGRKQDKRLNYFCKICKSYPCDNDLEWNLHILSHFPPKYSQQFNDTWYHVKETHLKCKICPNYDSLTVHGMQRHFIVNHPDIYRPMFKCRICHSFKTAMEQEIRQHEAAHFQQPSSLQSLADLANTLLSSISVEDSNTCQQPAAVPLATTSSDNRFSPKPVENRNNSYQPDSRPSLVNNLPPRQSAENSNEFQQPALNPSVIGTSVDLSSLLKMNIFTNSELESILQLNSNSHNSQQRGLTAPITSSSNNLPLTQPKPSLDNVQPPGQIHQPDDHSNNVQQSSLAPPVTNIGNKLPALQPINIPSNFRGRLWIPPPVNPANNLALFKPQQSSKKSQKPVQTFQSDNSSNNFLLSIPNSSVPNAGGNLTLVQPIENSKKQQSCTIPPVTSLGNNLPPEYFINAQQSGETFQSRNNSTNVQQLIAIPTVTSASTSLASLQSIGNPQCLTTAAPTFQLQINSASPFDNMTNVVHTLPLYVANVVYCCRICKVYKCSTEQELKIHESLHELVQLGETSSKGLFRCKLCPNVFCLTEEQLRGHVDVYHKADKSNVSQNRTRSDIGDSQLKCKYCLQIFSSSGQLMQHVHRAHTQIINQTPNETQFQNTYPYPCQICSIGFLNEGLLLAHIRLIHPNVKLPSQKTNDPKTLYQCGTCGLLLISEATLNYHMRSHNVRYH